MQRIFNVNLVLCENFDKENKTIYKMFNEIITDTDHTATFSLVTFLNVFGDEEDDSEFTLHYFLMEPKRDANGKKKGIYLGAIDFVRRNPDQSNETEGGEKSSTFADIRMNKVPFLHPAEYRIEAYKVKEKLKPGTDYAELRKKSAEYRKNGELVSLVKFDVKFPKR